MNYRIVSDSSSNILSSSDSRFLSVAMHIIINGKDWPDEPGTDVDQMTEALYTTGKPSSTSCPGPGQWLDAFGDAEHVFCVTITNQLSGSFESAMTAKRQYEEEHPGRHVYVIDSLATGPRMILLIDYMRELLALGTEPEEVWQKTLEYRKSTDLLFIMESVQNFVNNGRMNAILAKTIGILGMRFIGTASEEGKLKVLSKTRGTRKCLQFTVSYLKKCGYCGGRIIIAHHQNPSAASALASMLKEAFGDVSVEIQKTTALCSYYAERGGLLVGFEKPAAEHAAQAGGVGDAVRSLAKKTVGSLLHGTSADRTGK